MTDTTLGEDEIDRFVASCRPYWLLLYKKGPQRRQDDRTQAELQRGHLAHLLHLHRDGKLAIFGPLTDDGDLRGIALFTVEKSEEVRALTEQDPAVRAGRLVFEVHPWFGNPGTALPAK